MTENPTPPIIVPPIAEADTDGAEQEETPIDYDIRDMVDGYLS